MSDECKVWIRKRKCGDGSITYHLRWLDLDTHAWKSKKSGTDRTRAEREAALLEDKLRRGTYQEARQATWDEFVEAYIPTIAGEIHRKIAKRTLEDFGKIMHLAPRRVTHAAVKAYVVELRKRGNAAATINRACRYLRLAFNEAIEDGYIVKHPMGRRWKWEPEEEPMPREVTPAEEAALLRAAEDGDGWRFKALIEVALATGGRAGEVLGLSWERVKLEPVAEAEVTFVKTKGKKPRRVPVEDPELVKTLTKLKAQTQAIGGPFADWDYDEVHRMFDRAAAAAGCDDVTLHDLRRTFVTRLIRRGVELTAVKTLAGHAAIQTTLRYYNAVHSDPDLRAAVAKLRKGVAG